MTSILGFFLIYNFYTFITLIAGFIFRKIFLKNKLDSLTIGEVGIFGFLFTYFIVTIFHFLIPINLKFSLVFYFFCIIFFIFEFKNLKDFIRSNINKYLIFLYFLGFLTAVTNNLHDDWQLYQLPIINYMQQFKIIFGLISLNDYYGQGHSFYELMSVFQLPFIKNTSLYLLPVIFVVFFLSHILNIIRTTDNKGKLYLFFIIALILLRFSRSKEFGTDLPVICLLFIIQIYVLNFIQKPNIELLFKVVILFIFAVFLKIYAALAILYLLFLLKKNNFNFVLDIFKFNRLSFFIIFLILISFSKNIITSGCFFYQLKNMCIDKNVASWSVGNKVANERHIFTSASSKGWKAYVRTENPKKFVSAEEYLEISKFNYLKYLSKDAIFDRLIITLLICFIFIIFHIKNLKKIEINKIFSSNSILLFGSFIAVIIWILKIPNVRYGGYAYVPFLIFMVIFYFYDLKEVNKKFIKIFIFLCLIFFTSKNLNRVYEEMSVDKSLNYPFSNFKKIEYKTQYVKNFEINVPVNQLWCGNIPMLCSSGDYLINNVILKNSYIFLFSKEKDMIKFINRTAYYDIIEENYIEK